MQIADISIIVAASTNSVIGKDNDIPWHLPTDLKNFKKITEGHTVIMGRKCWESIPEKYRPLPNRRNVVLTRNENYVAEGAEVVHDLLEAMDIYIHDNENNEVFIIGGAQIYKDAFPYATKLYLTHVYGDVEGDVKLEGLDPNDWNPIEIGDELEENGKQFRFETYDRRTKKVLG